MKDDCFIFEKPNMDDIFHNFITLTYKVDASNWQYVSYDEIDSDKQKEEVLNYKKKTKNFIKNYVKRIYTNL